MYTTPGKDLDQSDVLGSVYFFCDDCKHDGVLLTPVCDLVQSKAEYVVITAALPAFERLDAFLQNDWGKDLPEAARLRAEPLSKKKQGGIETKIAQLAGNFHFPRYHWMDPLPNEDKPRLVDFQRTVCMPHTELCKQLETQEITRKASIRSPWREQIPARYASYMSRVGVPERQAGTLEAHIRPWLSSCFDIQK